MFSDEKPKIYHYGKAAQQPRAWRDKRTAFDICHLMGSL
jgi:hypothetical protein